MKAIYNFNNSLFLCFFFLVFYYSCDSLIVNHDVRVARHAAATLSGHSQEVSTKSLFRLSIIFVFICTGIDMIHSHSPPFIPLRTLQVCGLKWSPDGETLASGGNDNMVCLWDAATSSSSTPRFRFSDHQAAVKAVAWSPHERNLLATGGGAADRCIKFWNTHTGSLLNSIDTGSQVCSLQWNPFEKEILSSHGYARNQLCLWKYPSMAKVKELEGHTSRVLHMACSPDGGTVVSAAADETLRFWEVFAPPSKSKHQHGSNSHFSSSSSKHSWTMQVR